MRCFKYTSSSRSRRTRICSSSSNSSSKPPYGHPCFAQSPHCLPLRPPRPAPHARTRILSYSLQIEPQPHFLNWQQDPQSNYLARVVFPESTDAFSVVVDLVAEMSVFNPFDFFLEPAAERFPFSYDPALDHELQPFRCTCELTPRFRACLEEIRRELPRDDAPRDSHPRTLDFLVSVNQRLWRDLKYLIRLEPGVQTPEQTLTQRSGSCRDSAWLLCQLLRHCGLATRFVSGYLIQLRPDVASLDGPSGAERDFTDLHAWCEVYLPGAGWIGLDPTSGLLAGEGHVPLAAAPDPTSAAPITGVVDECKCEFDVGMTVTRIHESPRVTLPYSDAQWQAIDALGQQIDADLEKHDVRLTMGGEPTFVSIDDFDAAEWNTSALGPMKRGLADELLRRLQRQFAPGAFLHHAQGKWYPGESLPRWSFACYWRRDGVPLWHDHRLIADAAKNYGFNATQSASFAAALATRLGVDPDCILPGFEDTWHYLWKERRLPANLDPSASNLREAEERARLARVFEQGLDRTVGHVLPLQRGEDGWTSGRWHLRTPRLYLIPGDSPMGLRLPLDSLPWIPEKDRPHLEPPDPSIPRSPLPRPQPPLPSRPVNRPMPLRAGARPTVITPSLPLPAVVAPPAADPAPPSAESAAAVVRTALCVEAREGRLHVFLPPVTRLEDYLELVAAIEETAAEEETPVLLEGYPPPPDPRLNVLKVTPDPGVIEVNLHPSHSWSELVARTTTVYAEARQSRLGTEKFMLDGRHTGTGGGNHVILGGATPLDSPLLRRPDLLRSLVSYWQNHPALSYLFSGMFIGPTSQAPRIDEARHDSLHELETAFRQIPERGPVAPWLVDRLFRHLLVDATGNTHRAEFSIDKLYSPDGSAGRLGLLELRGFEMPPHARMSLTQQLLLRALVSRFWQEPYTQPLVRWGTAIHDRWMLPHFLWQDLEDVVNDLRPAGYPMSLDWFAPHYEFRFPFVGDLEARGLRLELRHALEPWHVLGEEAGAGGTVRYVDSSLERLQLKVSGATDARHVITVNGHAAPLHPTGTSGEFVAGVRYRAWQPPSCLHPTIGVHSPLVIDIVDTWNGRSLAGCTYHVAHPGGRNHTSFPVNAYEAESRRLARFFRLGHTPGKIAVAPAAVSPEFPLTLDLRNAPARPPAR